MKRKMRWIGLKGRLPLFAFSLMEGMVFKIRMKHQLSQEYEQESDIAQGSKLSVTMFFAIEYDKEVTGNRYLLRYAWMMFKCHMEMKALNSWSTFYRRNRWNRKGGNGEWAYYFGNEDCSFGSFLIDGNL